MSKQRRNRRDDEQYRRAYDAVLSHPAEAQELFARIADEMGDLGTRLQLSPEQMLAGIGVIAAAILLCNCDPRDEPEVNRLIAFASSAVHVGTAMHRIQVGAIAPRPDGTFGIRADA